jgi:hypothetical protein
MSGWARLWMVLTIVTAVSVGGVASVKWYEDIPSRWSFSAEVAQQFEEKECTQLRGEMLRTRLTVPRNERVKQYPNCVAYTDFVVLHANDDWIQTVEDYRRYIQNEEERHARHLRLAWLLPLFFAVPFGFLWGLYFAVRPILAWIARGFGRAAAD